MEDPTFPFQSEESLAETLAESISTQRDQVGKFLAKQQEQIDLAEAELAEGAQRLIEELPLSQCEADNAGILQDQIAKQEEQIKVLGALIEEVISRQSEWSEPQKLFKDQQDFFASQVREQKQNFEQFLAEIEKRQFEANPGEADRMGRQIEGELESKLGALERENIQLQEELANREPSTCDNSEELQNLRKERDLLAEQVAKMEQTMSDSSCFGGEEDHRRRYEMSIEEIRELKKQVKGLEDQLAIGGGAVGASSTADSVNWELQKQQIMASLETDFDGQDDRDLPERADIERIFEQTNQIVAAKDHEIDKLRRLLENNKDDYDLESVPGEATSNEVLNNDAIIREEREKLRRLQEEWNEKLRKTEIEISIERANIAREMAKLTEKERTLENCGKAEVGPADDEVGGGSRTGRWLERLGLQNLDEQ